MNPTPWHVVLCGIAWLTAGSAPSAPTDPWRILASAAAQADPPTKGAVRKAYGAWAKAEREAGLLALRLRRAQERWLDARGRLRAFRRATSPTQLSQAKKTELDALEAQMMTARRAYERLSRGEAGKRYRRLKGETEAAFSAASSAVGGRLRSAPDDLELRRMRALLLASKGRFTLVKRDVAALLKANPADPEALILDGRRRESEGAFKAAIERYRAALERTPNDEARLRCAVAHFWLNQFAEARALREQVEHLDQANPQLQLDHDWYLKAPQLERLERGWKRELELRAADAKRGDLPRVELTTSRGVIVLELFEDQAPNAVASFVSLAEGKFFDGQGWHRVQPLRLAASGRPGKKGKADPEGPGYRLAHEGGPKARQHFRGSVGLLATGRRQLLGSQFYVMLRPDLELDPYCTVFGRVVKGLEVVNQLRQDDLLQTVRVLRKRKHPYLPVKAPR